MGVRQRARRVSSNMVCVCLISSAKYVFPLFLFQIFVVCAGCMTVGRGGSSKIVRVCVCFLNPPQNTLFFVEWKLCVCVCAGGLPRHVCVCVFFFQISFVCACRV